VTPSVVWAWVCPLCSAWTPGPELLRGSQWKWLEGSVWWGVSEQGPNALPNLPDSPAPSLEGP
jgi:hypothetical protein